MADARVLFGENGEAEDVFPFPYLSLRTDAQKPYKTLSEALEIYYGTRDVRERLSQRSASMVRTLKSQLERCQRKLALQMEAVPVALQSGKNLEVSESIKKLADSIDQFCHIATLASLFPETFSSESLNGINFKDFFAEFSPILKDFEDALQNNDTVMLGDLSEYEICPRLKEISAALQNM